MTAPRPARQRPDTSQWCVAVVGMNATGKSRFGKRLAAKLQLRFIDSDTVFRQQFGDEHRFIADHGWPEFRNREAVIVSAALQPGTLVVLGGGAIEAESLRSELNQKAAVIWIEASPRRVYRQLKEAKRDRPEFADGFSRERVNDYIAARNPLYREVADIVIYNRIPFSRQLPIAQAELHKYYRRQSGTTV